MSSSRNLDSRFTARAAGLAEQIGEVAPRQVPGLLELALREAFNQGAEWADTTPLDRRA